MRLARFYPVAVLAVAIDDGACSLFGKHAFHSRGHLIFAAMIIDERRAAMVV